MAAPLTCEAHRVTALRLAGHLTGTSSGASPGSRVPTRPLPTSDGPGYSQRPVARHLAFGLWLRASGRLDGEFSLAPDQTR